MCVTVQRKSLCLFIFVKLIILISATIPEISDLIDPKIKHEIVISEKDPHYYSSADDIYDLYTELEKCTGRNFDRSGNRNRFYYVNKE